MHNKIIQISKEVIEKENWVNESEFYEFQPADYVADVRDEARENVIERFLSLPGIIPCENGFKVNKKEALQADFVRFKDQLEKLKDMSLNDFIEGSWAVHEFNSYYEDEFGLYIYQSIPIPFNTFVRGCNEDTVYYFGGVVDYHF